jgi:probable F420-dependent oxidoreductase
MRPDALARALETRGFESVWAPEHSHIPSSRATPFPQGGPLPQKYYEAMDPFVSLTAAAVATERLRIGTGVCLVTQRDPIQTAKLVASLDRLSAGRFLFGVGAGWNAEEMADHGTRFETRFALMRERIAAMAAVWTEDEPEFHGQYVDFAKMRSGPKPVQKPHPPVLVGGAFPYAARRALRYGDGWIPHGARPQYADVSEFMPQFHQMAAEIGRKLEDVPVTVFGVAKNYERLSRYRDRGVARAVVSLPSAAADEILPVLDRWGELIRGLR